MKHLLLLFAALLWASQSYATEREPLPELCLAAASSHYGVPRDLLLAIYSREGGKRGQESKTNSNGTKDLGWLQVNSSWLKSLSKIGITRETLKSEPCINLFVASWILRSDLDMTGGNWTDAIAAYNVGFRNRLGGIGQRYAKDVMARWAVIVRDRVAAGSALPIHSSDALEQVSVTGLSHPR